MPELTERFRAADELPVRDLWSDIRSREPGSPASPPMWPRVAAAIVAALVAIAGIAIAVRAFRPSPAPFMPPRSMTNGKILLYSGPQSVVSTMKPNGRGLRPVPGLPTTASLPAWSPNGRQISYAVNNGSRHEIWVARADGSGAEQIFRCNDHFDSPTCNRPYLGLTWSPDGRQIAFILGSMYVMNADGSDVHRLYSQDLQTALAPPAWSPDGRTILFAETTPGAPGTGGTNNLYLAAADGSGIRQLTHCGPIAEATCAPATPTWSRDGRTILFGDETTRAIRTIGVDGGPIRTLAAPPSNVTYMNPLWSPDGNRIVFVRVDGSESRVFEMNADGSDLHPITGAGRWILLSWQGLPK